jgi:glyoxylase-like metal-dependent hydrolase (beta-lactamase superfamily II)
MKALDKISIKPEEIRLIIFSHEHFDHVGAAKELKEVTGAKIVLHQADKDMKVLYVPFAKQPITKVDIVLDRSPSCPFLLKTHQKLEKAGSRY